MPTEPTHPLHGPTPDPEDRETAVASTEAPPEFATEAPADVDETPSAPEEAEAAEQPATEYQLREEGLAEEALPETETTPVPPPVESELHFNDPAPQEFPFTEAPPLPSPPTPPLANASVPPNAWATPPPAALRPAMLFGFPLRTVILIAAPLCLIAVVVAIYLLNGPGAESPSTTEASPAITIHTLPSADSLPAGSGIATPDAAPVTLPAGTTATGTLDDSGSGKNKVSSDSLLGRWLAKSGDFYEFRGDRSGVRGKAKSDKSSESFTWDLADNRLHLSVEQGVTMRQETLSFSLGPDNKALFLRQPDGHSREYSRASE